MLWDFFYLLGHNPAKVTWLKSGQLFGDRANLCTTVSPPVTSIFTTTTADHNHKNGSKGQKIKDKTQTEKHYLRIESLTLDSLPDCEMIRLQINYLWKYRLLFIWTGDSQRS